MNPGASVAVDSTALPEGTTHVWTPAVETPIVGWAMRRAYYRKVEDRWQSFSELLRAWLFTSNGPEWFVKETEAGYFVPVEKFTNPNFVMIKEIK